MVKVVGEAPEVVKRAVCRHCVAMLEYVPRDVKKRHDSDYLGDADIVTYIICPRCEHHVEV